MGQLAQMAGDFDAALNWLQPLCAEYPTDVEARYALAQALQATCHRTIEHLVANPDHESTQNGWVDTEGNIFCADLGQHIFSDGCLFIGIQRQSAGHFSSFTLETSTLQHDHLASFHTREELIEQSSLFLFIECLTDQLVRRGHRHLEIDHVAAHHRVSSDSFACEVQSATVARPSTLGDLVLRMDRAYASGKSRRADDGGHRTGARDRNTRGSARPAAAGCPEPS